MERLWPKSFFGGLLVPQPPTVLFLKVSAGEIVAWSRRCGCTVEGVGVFVVRGVNTTGVIDHGLGNWWCLFFRVSLFLVVFECGWRMADESGRAVGIPFVVGSAGVRGYTVCGRLCRA